MTWSWPRTLVVATHNPGKLSEWRRLLSPWAISIQAAAQLDLQAPAETEDSYVGNATLKALAAATATGLPALADDTGFELPALGGLPGVHTADYVADLGGWPAALADMATRSGIDAGATATGSLHCAVAFACSGNVTTAESHVCGDLHWPPSDAPGFAALLGGVDTLWNDGVLAHRRDAFAKLNAQLRSNTQRSETQVRPEA